MAIGSSVPQWPIFFVPSFCRATATTSCDVIPSALSTSRTPSGDAGALNGFTSFLQNFLFDFGEGTANARTGSERMAAAAKFLADRADINPLVFRTHTHAYLAVGKFLEKNSDDDAANCPEMIDQAFVVFGNNIEFRGGLQAEAERCDMAAFHKAHCSQQLAQ